MAVDNIETPVMHFDEAIVSQIADLRAAIDIDLNIVGPDP